MSEQVIPADNEVVGSITPTQPITVPFSKSFVSLLAKVEEGYQKERGKAISEEYEDLKLDPTCQWQINFEQKAWIGHPQPKPVT